MIWLTWRQFRAQAMTGLIALVVLAAYLVFLGLQVRSTYDASVGCTGCTLDAARTAMDNKYADVLQLTGFLVVLVPDNYAQAALAPGLDRLFGILFGMVLLEPVVLVAHAVWRRRHPREAPPPIIDLVKE